MTTTALSFESTTFDVVTRDNQPWLRGGQIAQALGYSQDNRIADLYNRNITEFTPSMTALVKLPDLNPQNAEAGQMREIRVFSLRGAHLLGMFARTDKAASFRKWVLDILDAHVAQLNHSHTDSITPSEQQNLQELVDAKCRGIADQGKARAEIWSRLHHKFRVAKYSQLPRTQLTAAQLYIMGMELRCDPFSRTEPPKAAPEYLTNEDMMNLKRMVWWISHSFRFEKSWSSGLWHHLRRVTNTPSPQQFTVDQLPRIARELQIATSAAEQVKDLMMELEKEACKRIFRRAEDADMVIADIRTKAAQQLKVRRQELAKFPSYLNTDLLAITDRKTGLYPRPECDETHGYFAA